MNDRFVDRVERANPAGDESPLGTARLASARQVTDIEMDCDQRA